MSAIQTHLAVDIGAESGRVMAGLWDGRRIRLQEIHRFANSAVAVGASLRWDLLHLWKEVRDGLALAGSGATLQTEVRSVG
ncbi:MAG: hypothetical protein ORN83_02225, partial [Chthoniobacteraceae bacterium]|nr:hypothetical protein [Chthoniobacteraceae bacterium]